jgi:hypothetical protein
MQASQRRTEVLGPLRARACKAAGSKLDDKLALQLAIACAMREADDVVEFIAPRHVAKQVLGQASEVAITPAEWESVFGRQMPPLRDGGVTAVVQSSEFQPEIVAIGEALKCTVAEQEQSAQYARAWTRALCYVGMHLNESDSALESTLGNLVRADGRRMDELRENLDDEGVDTMLMTKVLTALADSVT